ncbi:hypothetical protein LJR030_001368 [Rhizobium sp. LjRoot30]|uniref:hypothetical protein n=1 Tax=Rhizobium sp. LjRoot30 TaxID=3342320 RepID=UPI003ECEF023
METSKHSDRERRQMKVKTRNTWISILVRPATIRFLTAVGKVITPVVWLIYHVIKVLKE